MGQLLVAVVTKEAPPISSLAPWVPAPIAGIAHRAISLDALKRYQGVQHMLREIHEVTGGDLTIREGAVVGACR
jgi:serine/threonine-protein kinase